MATKDSTAQFLEEQAAGAGAVRIRKMFGEYALYCDDKVVALICDDRLYLKPTDAGKAFGGSFEEGQAYPGSSTFWIVDEDRWDNREWMSELIRVTSEALPKPKPKKPRKSAPTNKIHRKGN